MIRDIEIRAERPSLEEAQAIVGGLIEIGAEWEFCRIIRGL